jgi:archaellum component FlaG (FlaF/FlaG flagellin family)
MGASTVVAELMFFIAVLGMTTVAIIVLTNYVGQTTSAVSTKQRDMISQIQTNIDITSINASSTNTKVYVKNIGDTDLRIDCMDLFLDNAWSNNFSVKNPDTLALYSNTTLWTPLETILVDANHTAISAVASHSMRVVACNGVSDSYIFSI